MKRKDYISCARSFQRVVVTGGRAAWTVAEKGVCPSQSSVSSMTRFRSARDWSERWDVIWSIVSGTLMRFSIASGRVLRSPKRTERDNRSQGCGQGRESNVRMYQDGRGDDENEKCGWSILPVCLGTAEWNTRRCAENRFATRYPGAVHDSAGPTCTTVTVGTGL